MDSILAGLALSLQAETLLVILLSSIFGIVVGALPGLTATMAISLLIPVTFFLEPVPAIAAIIAASAMAIFAGDIPSALLRIPGTPASAAYTDDAYALTRAGRPDLSLGACLVSSVVGGVIGVAILIAVSPLLARFAMRFSSVEYFWLAVLGLSCAVAVTGASVVRGAISLLIGLFISGIGIDIATGYARFTFGSINLLDGISFIPAMIGFFAVSQVLRSALHPGRGERVRVGPIRGLWRAMGRQVWQHKANVLRSSLIGNLLGALPGAGADIAAWVAYSVSKAFSKDKPRYGHGSEEGLMGAGAANNSALAGAWTPALVLGIPGDSITAIAVGVLLMKGVTPGPQVFQTDGAEVNAIFFCFLFANLLMLPLGYLAIRWSRHILSIPETALMPLILLFSIVGAFAVDRSMFSVGVIAALGVFAFFLEENDIPVAPAILGIVLGEVLEKNFLITMIKTQGDFLAFFDRPLAAVLGLLAIAVWLAVIARSLLSLRARASTPEETAR